MSIGWWTSGTARPFTLVGARKPCFYSRDHNVLTEKLLRIRQISLDGFEVLMSSTAVVIGGLVTVFAIGALIYALAIFGLGFAARAGLRRGDSVLVSR